MIATRLAVGVGSAAGLLARRRDGLLFAASTTFTGWPQLVDRFVAADDVETARDAVLDDVVSASFAIDPFAMVTWSDAVHVHVLGDLTLTTDLPTLPMLSGRGSATWVEHRAHRASSPCRLWLGEEPSQPSDLGAGIVPADGFSLELAPGPESLDPPQLTVRHVPTTGVTSAPAPASEPPQAPELVPDLLVAPARRGSASGLEALHAAVGDDWMEDSLGLPPPPDARLHAGATSSSPMSDVDFDPEITLEPLAIAAVATDIAEANAADGTAADPPRGTPRPRTVQARRCPNQHVNPPSAALCRVCREPIVPSGPLEVVPQPALGSLVLPDGKKLPIDGNLVIGRSPSAPAARVAEPCTLLPLAVGNDVSRTHVVVRANGWTLEAVDCESSGQTVLVSALAPQAEPTLLEPWVPHELATGDVLYLGGPTQLRIER